MNKKIQLIGVSISVLLLTACNSTPKSKQFNIDRAKNISRIQYTLERHQSDNGHKAMAVALDAEGKYVIGYSFDAKTAQRAKEIALHRCQSANANATIPAQAECKLYSVDNQKLRTL